MSAGEWRVGGRILTVAGCSVLLALGILLPAEGATQTPGADAVTPAATLAPEEPSGSTGSPADRFYIARIRLVIPPSTGVAIPSAMGAVWGDVFTGVSYQERTRYRRADDGAVVVGFGLGNPVDWVGLEVAFTSYSTVRSGFLNRTALSVKAHRHVGDGWGMAAGVENAVHTSGNGGDGGSSPYLMVSRTVSLREFDRALSALVFSVGAGGGRFRSEERVLADRGAVSPFGGVAARLSPRVSLVADWTGQDLASALSVTPFYRFPVVVNVGLADLVGTAGDGPRLILSAGTGFSLVRGNGS